MTDDILATIDVATEERCACGCGKPIPAGGLSAWFAAEDCQRRWHGRRTKSDEVLAQGPRTWWDRRTVRAASVHDIMRAMREMYRPTHTVLAVVESPHLPGDPTQAGRRP
ncbi:MAG TPA: hypothetical protein VK453_25285 [Micromonosporaceae bacterium]|nr:hypothetical protein [Micromonosporaceae bacterium]